MQASIRTFRMLALLMVVLLVAAGCSSDDDGDDGDSGSDSASATETTEPEPTEESSESESDEDNAATETPDADAESEETAEQGEGGESSAERRIEPYELTLVGENGEQSGRIGPYFWTNEELELAAEAQGGFYERHEEPLEVASGEELTIEASEDFPNEIMLDVFSTVEPNDSNLVEMPSEPEDSQEIEAGDESWTVELDPGEYYIELETVWPTDEVWGRDREVTYRYWLDVSE